MLSLAVWYMSISDAFGSFTMVVMVLSLIVGGVFGIVSFAAAADSEAHPLPPRVWKIWFTTLATSIALVVLVPTDPGHVAYLINSNVAMAKQEGRSVPNLNAEEQSLINALAIMYVTKTHKGYVAASQGEKKK